MSHIALLKSPVVVVTAQEQGNKALVTTYLQNTLLRIKIHEMYETAEFKVFGALYLTILTIYFQTDIVKCNTAILEDLQNRRKFSAEKFLSHNDLFSRLTKDLSDLGQSDASNFYNYDIHEEILQKFSFSPYLRSPKKYSNQFKKTYSTICGVFNNSWKVRKQKLCACVKFNKCIGKKEDLVTKDRTEKIKKQRGKRNVFNEIFLKSSRNSMEGDVLKWKSSRHEITHYNENDKKDRLSLNVSSSDNVNFSWKDDDLLKERTADNNQLISSKSADAKDFITDLIKGFKDNFEDTLEQDEEDNPELKMTSRKKRKKKKKKRKWQKFLVPLLLAYKLKFFALIPVMMGGLVLMVGSTGLAGFFFALFTAVMSLRGAGTHIHG